MKIIYFVCLYILLVCAATEAKPANEFQNNTVSSAAKLEELQCSYTLNVVNLLLDYFRQIVDKLSNNDKLNESKDSQIRVPNVRVAELQRELADNVQKDWVIEVYKKSEDSNAAQKVFLRETVKQLSQRCQSKGESDQEAELNRTVAAQSETIKDQISQIRHLKQQFDLNSEQLQKSENQLVIQTALVGQKDEQILNLQTEQLNMAKSLKETQVNFNDREELFKEDSCLPFANYPGTHKIQVPGIAPFDVLCANSETEPGWIVVQQRVNGKEDFYRDWATYRAGFGSFEGDFFLGLEKIHRLTSNRRHKLYINLETYYGRVAYAFYGNFAIAGEEDQYKLISLDGYSGNTGTDNYMEPNKGKSFYTFDRDNKNKCASKHHGGWWYNNCTDANLNGKYFDHEVEDETSNFWYFSTSLKKVQMLIRPY